MNSEEIIEAVNTINEHDLFKKYGFKVGLIDGMVFVRKEPYFEDNKEFIEKYDLKIYDRPNYQRYLLEMHKQMLLYQNKKV